MTAAVLRMTARNASFAALEERRDDS